MGFNVGDEVRSLNTVKNNGYQVVSGRVYTVRNAYMSSVMVSVGPVWWSSGGFELVCAAMPPPHGAAGTPQAPPESEVSDIQGFEFLEEIEPPKELTPEEKLIEYRRGLKKMLGNF